ncbi:MAG TPA: glycosyltransferase family 2 protein [Pyrinomonadaceae bacterium]|nr:glycosyltransferase family 2 protein [Pyrinomonadaceae bacterium]
MLISVVVPCYNEEPVIRETHRRLRLTLETLTELDHEVVYVDDGSSDATAALLRELQAEDEHVRIVLLSRNFGHQMAVTAGLEHAAGDAVVVIDADLQDPPEVIPEMVERWRDGYHVVYGLRTDREGETRFKLWTAKLFYKLMSRLSRTKIPLEVGDFRLMDSKVVESLRAMPERDRFLRGMISWVGFRQVAVLYRRSPRYAGVTKYSLGKMARFAVDGVVSFSSAPLRLAIWTGFAAIGVALLGIVYALFGRFITGDVVRGWASLFVAVLFMSGVQLICIGLIGEYIGRIYGEVKHRPLYFVQERLGFTNTPRHTHENRKAEAEQR